MNVKLGTILGILSIIISFIIAIDNLVYAFVPFVILVIMLLGSKTFRKSPLMFFVLPWSFMYIMYFTDIITYSQDTRNIAPLLYITICNTLIILGYHFSSRIKYSIPKRQLNGEANLINCKKIISILAILGLLGNLCFAYELLFITGINISEIVSVRSTFISRNVTVFSQIGSLLSWGSITALPAIILLREKTSKAERTIWLLSAGFYSLYSILSAGRQVIFQILLVLVSTLIIRSSLHKRDNILVLYDNISKRNKKRIKIGIIILALLIIIYMFFIAGSRNDGSISSKKWDVLSLYFGARLNPKIGDIYSILPKSLADGLSEALVYFTHEIPQFTVYWDIDRSFGPFLGFYSMPFLDRRLYSLGIADVSVEEKMQYVRNFMSSQGAMPVGWKTFYSYILLDWGLIGGVFFCFIYGIYIGYVYKNFMKKRSLISAIWLIRTEIGLFYTVIFPATCETGLLLMGIFCIIMNYVENRHPYLKYTLQPLDII